MNQHHLAEAMRAHGVDLVCSVPCGGMPRLFFWLPRAFRHVGLTREEDGVGIAAGAWLAGARPMLALQSSGLGNMLNALLSLTVAYRLPLPILASWRGGAQERIPAQRPFNDRLPDILAAAGVPCTVVTSPEHHGQVAAAIGDAFEARRPHVILMRPSCFAWEGEPPGPMSPARGRGGEPRWDGEVPAPEMTRIEAIRAAAASCPEDALIVTLGGPSKELFAAGDRPAAFYMLGSYTQASAIGLGVALASPRRQVIVLDGDGSLLGSAILPVIAAAAPSNLIVACLDNGVFGSTGDQPRPGVRSADLPAMALAAGFPRAARAHRPDSLAAALRASLGTLSFIHVPVLPGAAAVAEVPLSMEEIRDRFMRALC